MDHYDGDEIINIGCGQDMTIKDLTQIIKKVSSFRGEILFDTAKPDGAMQKLLDSQRIMQLGWKPAVFLEDGIRMMWDWYVKEQRKEK